MNELDTTASSVMSKGMVGGSGISIVGYMTSDEFILFVGVLTTVLGFIVNLVFKIREDRRRQELHKANLNAINEEAAEG